jgi:hypothetical protein
MSSSDVAPLFHDERNAYAPPLSETGSTPDSDDVKGRPLALGTILLRSWRIFSARPQDCVGVFLACAPLYIVAAEVVAVLATPLEARRPPQFGAIAALFGFLGFVLFHAWVTVGQVMVLIDVARGREFDFGKVFGGARFVLRATFAGVLFAIAGVLPMMIALSVVEVIVSTILYSVSELGPIVRVLGVITEVLLALLVVSVALLPGVRLSQFLFLIIDRNVGVLKSMRLSFLITRGHVRQMYLLALVALGINIVGLMPYSLGVIFTAPFTALLLVVTYEALLTQLPTGATPKGKPVGDGELELL